MADTYQYDDGLDDGTDVFQREPYAVRFTSPTTGIQCPDVRISRVAMMMMIVIIMTMMMILMNVTKRDGEGR